MKCPSYPETTQNVYKIKSDSLASLRPNIWGVEQKKSSALGLSSETPYGCEKPITLCEAFVRKYFTIRKNDVCMQIRRWVDEADQIQQVYQAPSNPYSGRNLEEQEKVPHTPEMAGSHSKMI